MSTTVIRNATMLVTMDAQRREIADGALLIDGQEILWVGRAQTLPIHLSAEVKQAHRRQGQAGAARLCQHPSPFLPDPHPRHPAAQDAVLFDWLKTLYPIWAETDTSRCSRSAPNWP